MQRGFLTESDIPFEVAAGGPPNPAKLPNIDFGGCIKDWLLIILYTDFKRHAHTSASPGVDGVGVAPAPRLFGKPLILKAVIGQRQFFDSLTVYGNG